MTTANQRTLASLSPERKAALARRLAQRGASIRRLPRDGGPLRCSFEQRRMWLAAQVDPEAVTNVTAGLSLSGALEPEHLRAAVASLLDRHETLRTVFVDIDGEPFQEVLPALDPPFEVTDLTGVPAAERAGRARELAAAAAGERFDLARAPLFRVHLYRLAPDEHRLLFVGHHINSDGWSVDNAVTELAAAYRAHRDGVPPDVPPLPVQYADYAAWSHRRLDDASRRERLAYWTDRLSEPPATIHPGTPEPSASRTAEVVTAAPADLVEAVRRAGGPSTTVFLTFLTAYKALLMRLGGEREVTVGSVTGGRGRTELEPLIGCFLNLLPLRTELGPDLDFRQAAGRVRDTVAGALSNELPFDELTSALNPGRGDRTSAMFQSAVVLQRTHADPRAWPGLAVRRWGGTLDEAAFDLGLLVRELPDGYELSFRYRADRFAAGTVRRLATQFDTFLRSIAAAPEAPLGDHELLSPDERDQVVNRWNATGTVEPAWGRLHHVIDAQVRSDPDADAVVFGDRVLTYGALAGDSTRLARHLRDAGAGPDVPVGICLEQGVETAVAVFGVLKAGAAYLPLDPELPDGRLAFMLSDAAAPAVVTVTSLLPKFTGYPGRVVCLDEPDWEREPDEPFADGSTPESLAYVIYTSGSTGTPKGVAVQHRQILNYLEGVRLRFGIVPGSSFGLLQTLTFDFAITPFYLALATGGCLHLLPRRASGGELAGRLARTPIDYLKMTPSHLAALAEETGAAALLPRRALILGGEASRTDWARELARAGTCRVFNHYGPTEATVGATTWEVTDDGPAGAVAPIGRPLPGARVYVLDEGRRPVPIGVAGEIHLAGDRLARGYLGRPSLTAEKFLDDPFLPGGRMYRTGDLGRFLPDGTLEFLGRRDHQVKIRGYRVELGEVESALAACAGVVQAVATVRDGGLVGYLEGTARTPAAELRADLAGRLPGYMVPGRFVWLDRFPLQAHGKVDRKRLPEPPDDDRGRESEYVEPVGPIERAIAETWADVLRVDRVGALDDFFDLGGHSLLATQIVARLRRVLPAECRPVSVVDLFGEPTVRALARLAATDTAAERPLLHQLTPRGRGAPSASYVCVPYGGANAVVFQPLADALPDGHALFAVAVPGNDIALAEESRPIEVVARRCAEEILERVHGPLVLYGHCGPGGALTVEIALRLEAAGRAVEAVYLGGIFPFARPDGRFLGPLYRAFRIERLRSDAVYATWLQSIGADMGEIDPEQQAFLVRAMRKDAENAEEFFTGLLAQGAKPLAAPIISVVGDRDPGTEFYRERFREWDFLTSATGLVVLDEAGHYFLKYRAAELAAIVTSVHRDLSVRERRPDDTWWLEAVGDPAAPDEPPAAGKPPVQPNMARFLTIAAGQMASLIGTALTEYAIPMWTYLQTGSLFRFTVFALVALVPGLLAAPLLGALVDRSDRRRALLASGIAAGSIQGVLLLLLVFTGGLGTVSLYALLALLSVALTAQRLAYASAVPQLIPKRYMGHANGVVQFTMGVARFLVPVVAVGMLAATGLEMILLLDVVSYVFAVGVLLLVRFPATMPWRSRESLADEIRNGFGYLWRRPGLRAMVVYFFVLNMFLAAAFVLISPLALAVGALREAGWVAMIAGVGAVSGGVLMALWGGPRRRRMHGMLLGSLCFAAFCALTGLRPSLPLIALGVFGMSLVMAVIDGIWMTVIHTKVPHRFHARVIAVNQMLAMSTQPLGFLLIAPLAPALFGPLLQPDGALADSVGVVLGVGDGRGIGLVYVLCGLCIAVWTAAAMRHPLLARFDTEIPDAEPDDLVGLRAIQQRPTAQERTEAPDTD